MREEIEFAIGAAVRAPSPLNTQPWRFTSTDDRVDVFLDRDRVLPVADPDAREARLACGAVVFNLRLTLKVSGRASTVNWLPEAPDHVASVRLGQLATPNPLERRLAAAVGTRRSHRRPFTGAPVPTAIRGLLCRAATAEGAKLILIEQRPQLLAVAELVRRADSIQQADQAYLDEVRQFSTITPVADAARDDTGLLRPRRFTQAAPIRVYEDPPLLAVLHSYREDELAWLRAGAAMQRVLLTATASGVSSSFLSHVIEVPKTREALRGLSSGGTYPQTVLRFGRRAIGAQHQGLALRDSTGPAVVARGSPTLPAQTRSTRPGSDALLRCRARHLRDRTARTR